MKRLRRLAERVGLRDTRIREYIGRVGFGLSEDCDQVTFLIASHEYLAERGRALRAELSDTRELVQRQSDLLTGAVNALRGQPPELTLWSHHDVGDLARSLVEERDALREEVEALRELEAEANSIADDFLPTSFYRVLEKVRAWRGGELRR